MIKEIKNYTKYGIGLPTVEDLQDALDIAVANKCIVRLSGKSKYGVYEMSINEGNTLGNLVDKVKRML